MENVIPFQLAADGEKLLEAIIYKKLNTLIDDVKNSAATYPMTPEQVADYFNVTQPTIDKWVREGMPKHKEGATVRYYKDEVDEWFKSR